MHDIRWIRENPAKFDSALAKRGVETMSADLVQRDADRRAVQTELQELQTRRNDASKQIGVAKGKGQLLNETGASLPDVITTNIYEIPTRQMLCTVLKEVYSHLQRRTGRKDVVPPGDELL